MPRPQPPVVVVPGITATHLCHLKGDGGGKGTAHGGVWGRRAPDVGPEASWKPPLEGLGEKR